MRIRLRSTYAVGLAAGRSEKSKLESRDELELASGTTVQQLLERFPGLGPPDSYDDIMIHVFVNGVLRGFDHLLENGDVIDIHIPVSGG